VLRHVAGLSPHEIADRGLRPRHPPSRPTGA